MDYDKIARNLSKQVGMVRTAGRVEFVKDQGPLQRDIRAADFEWSPDALRNLTKILWAAQRAHSYSVSALRLFSKMPSSQFSPDGLLGGRGYIESVKNLRKNLSQASEFLSSFTDTLYDEINASHWEESETEDSKNLLEETEEVKENPEGFVEDEYEAEGESDFMDTNISEMNPSPPEYVEDEEKTEEDEEEYPFSQQASRLKSRLADSSVPLSTLPGPRVQRIGPGMAEYGWENDPSALPSDDESLSGLSSGVNTTKPIYEDYCTDGVSGYENPTDGDTTTLKVSSDGYSWLPGSENLKSMPFYERGLTDKEIEWMVANSAPHNPMSPNPHKEKNQTSWVWKDV